MAGGLRFAENLVLYGTESVFQAALWMWDDPLLKFLSILGIVITIFLALYLWASTHPFYEESPSPGPLPAFCQYDQKRELIFQSIYIQFQQRVEDQRSIKRTHWRMIESKWPLAIGGKWLPLWSAGPNAAEDGKTWLASPPWITYWAPGRSLDMLDTQTREIIWKNLMLSNTSWDAHILLAKFNG